MYRWSAAPWPFIGILFAASSPVSVIESFDVGKLLFFPKNKRLGCEESDGELPPPGGPKPPGSLNSQPLP